MEQWHGGFMPSVGWTGGLQHGAGPSWHLRPQRYSLLLCEKISFSKGCADECIDVKGSEERKRYTLEN